MSGAPAGAPARADMRRHEAAALLSGGCQGMRISRHRNPGPVPGGGQDMASRSTRSQTVPVARSAHPPLQSGGMTPFSDPTDHDPARPNMPDVLRWFLTCWLRAAGGTHAGTKAPRWSPQNPGAVAEAVPSPERTGMETSDPDSNARMIALDPTVPQTPQTLKRYAGPRTRTHTVDSEPDHTTQGPNRHAYATRAPRGTQTQPAGRQIPTRC